MDNCEDPKECNGVSETEAQIDENKAGKNDDIIATSYALSEIPLILIHMHRWFYIDINTIE